MRKFHNYSAYICYDNIPKNMNRADNMMHIIIPADNIMDKVGLVCYESNHLCVLR